MARGRRTRATNSKQTYEWQTRNKNKKNSNGTVEKKKSCTSFVPASLYAFLGGSCSFPRAFSGSSPSRGSGPGSSKRTGLQLHLRLGQLPMRISRGKGIKKSEKMEGNAEEAAASAHAVYLDLPSVKQQAGFDAFPPRDVHRVVRGALVAKVLLRNSGRCR